MSEKIQRVVIDCSQAFDDYRQSLPQLTNQDWDMFTLFEELVTTTMMSESIERVQELIDHITSFHEPDHETELARRIVRQLASAIRQQLLIINPRLDTTPTPFYVEAVHGGLIILQRRNT